MHEPDGIAALEERTFARPPGSSYSCSRQALSQQRLTEAQL
jgi:hypothetical protein